MVIKKSVHPRTLPGIHPGLQQKIREAEEAEERGESPRRVGDAQKVLRPSPEVGSKERASQLRTVGLVEPAYRAMVDGRIALAEQAPFRPGEDLDAIWDELGEADKIRAGAVERFRLELEATLQKASRNWQPPHKLGGRLDARALQRSSANLDAEVASLGHLLAPDSAALLQRFVIDTRRLLELCHRHNAIAGIDAVSMHELLRDLVHKLVYQELTSRRRAMGDRGIRRICGNIDLADTVYDQLQRFPFYSPRMRLVMRVIHVHQDLGHTAYAARVSYRGSKLHRAYGARIFTDEMERYRPLLTHDELTLTRSAVATHSSEDFPFANALILALVRAIDHLAPFAPHRVYLHLRDISGAGDYLTDMLERARAGDFERYLAAKAAFAAFLHNESDLDPNLCEDIVASLRPVERLADLVELGGLAGDIGELTLDAKPPGALGATLRADAFAERFQALFDYQQEQLGRLARVSGVAAAELQGAAQVRFQQGDLGALVVRRG